MEYTRILIGGHLIVIRKMPIKWHVEKSGGTGVRSISAFMSYDLARKYAVSLVDRIIDDLNPEV